MPADDMMEVKTIRSGSESVFIQRGNGSIEDWAQLRVYREFIAFDGEPRTQMFAVSGTITDPLLLSLIAGVFDDLRDWPALVDYLADHLEDMALIVGSSSFARTILERLCPLTR